MTQHSLFKDDTPLSESRLTGAIPYLSTLSRLFFLSRWQIVIVIMFRAGRSLARAGLSGLVTNLFFDDSHAPSSAASLLKHFSRLCRNCLENRKHSLLIHLKARARGQLRYLEQYYCSERLNDCNFLYPSRVFRAFLQHWGLVIIITFTWLVIALEGCQHII